MNTIINADCLGVMEKIPDNYFQLLIVDPPYFEIKGEFDFVWNNFDEYLEWIERLAVEFKRILSDNGSLYIYGHAKRIAYKQIIFDKYFNLENNIVWEKIDGMQRKYLKTDQFKSFPPVTERILFYSKNRCKTINERINENLSNWESIIGKLQSCDFTKDKIESIFEEDGRYTSRESIKTHSSFKFGLGSRFDLMDKKLFDISNKYFNYNFTYNEIKNEYDILKATYMTTYTATDRPFNNSYCLSDVMLFSQEAHITKKYKHPTQKPQKLTRALISTSTKEDSKVFIPFVGSGSEAEACKSLGLDWCGCELEADYVAIANKRLTQVQGSLF